MSIDDDKYPVLVFRHLLRRAKAAYYRAGGNDQPSKHSGVRTVNDKDYIHLFNVRGTLAVYRVQPRLGRLKRLKRWPKALEGSDAWLKTIEAAQRG